MKNYYFDGIDGTDGFTPNPEPTILMVSYLQLNLFLIFFLEHVEFNFQYIFSTSI